MKESYDVSGETEQEQKTIKQGTIHKFLNRFHRSKEATAPVETEAVEERPVEAEETPDEAPEEIEAKQRREITNYLLSYHTDQLKDEGLKRSDIKAMSLEELQNLQDRLTFKIHNKEEPSANPDEELQKEVWKLASRKKEIERHKEEMSDFLNNFQNDPHVQKLLASEQLNHRNEVNDEVNNVVVSMVLLQAGVETQKALKRCRPEAIALCYDELQGAGADTSVMDEILEKAGIDREEFAKQINEARGEN